MTRLRQLREQKKLTQKDVAKYINKTVQAYSLYEIGQREPDFETLKMLSRLFEVSVDYIIGNKPNEISETDYKKMNWNALTYVLEDIQKIIDKLSGANHEDLKNIAMYTDYVLEQRAKKSGDAGGAAEAASK